jgi:exosortase
MIIEAGKQGAKAAGNAQSGSPVRWLSLVFALGALALYLPTLLDAGQQWMINDNYAHGVFIFPLCAFLLWLRQDDIRSAPVQPSIWGLPLLIVGIFLQSASYLLQVKYVGMWSLALTLTGGVLMLFGPVMLRIVRFAIVFSLLANPLPHSLLSGMTVWIQNASTLGAAGLMDILGFTVVRNGNVIQVPGAVLEVAAACSGFHKFLSLSAFTLLYGYLFTESNRIRLILMVCVLPIALIANILRIAGLIGAATSGGLTALHAAHDMAEYLAILLAFGLLVLLGRSLGCRNLRFSL